MLILGMAHKTDRQWCAGHRPVEPLAPAGTGYRPGSPGPCTFIGTALIFPGNAEETLGLFEKRLNRPALTINPDDFVVRDGQVRTPEGQPWL